jgi:gas vesicle protein
MKNSNKVLIAVGSGLVVGGILGILFAPDKGENTRKKITDSGKKLTDTVKDTLQKGKEKLICHKNGMKEMAGAAAEEVDAFE